ncbi:hypothetical protein NC653_005587 [Populus alba x Populus x berolinensis]|uniref:Secreted protein n=1 Tax=Populus alba x Populus x berolinensis TaxID=444605 RepID=A0AAD6WB48_9ROSI|nr:hypothetical protein NC653_005587 [Populus alba x Populus x berolinensis]
MLSSLWLVCIQWRGAGSFHLKLESVLERLLVVLKFGMHVRNCSVIGPLPLLLLGTETVVAPAEDGSEEDDDNDDDSADGAESDEDGMETDGRLGTQHGERALSAAAALIQIK